MTVIPWAFLFCAFISLTIVKSQEDLGESYYSLCSDGKNTNCIGTTIEADADCLNKKNCTVIAAVSYTEDEVYEFSMLGKQQQYVAMGISNDTDMGEDYVIACFTTEGEKIEWGLFYNEHHTPVPVPQAIEGGLKEIEAKIVDGDISCKFSILNNLATLISLHKTGGYNILAATGPYNASASALKYHSARVASTDKWTFNSGLPSDLDESYYSLCSDKNNTNCIGTTDEADADCLNKKNCTVIAAVSYIEDEGYEFSMLGKNKQYVAVGISNDTNMGDDYVIACFITEDETIGWGLFYNVQYTPVPQTLRPNHTSHFTSRQAVWWTKLSQRFSLNSYTFVDFGKYKLKVFDEGLKGSEAKVVDGELSCKFSILDDLAQSISLYKSDGYNLLAAAGPYNASASALKHHTARVASKEKLTFNSGSHLAGSVAILLLASVFSSRI